MGVNGKGTFVPAEGRRPLFRGVRFHVMGLKGKIIESVINSSDIRYIDSDMRDGTTIVILKDGLTIHVTEKGYEAANQWGQRENVVKYGRVFDGDMIPEVTLRVDDITGIDISTRDNYTVLVKAEFGVFPVVGKHETVVDKASYCRPFAVFHKMTDSSPSLIAVPIDMITGVETSGIDSSTLVRTQIGKIRIAESVDEAIATIDREADEFEAGLAEAESPMKKRP